MPHPFFSDLILTPGTTGSPALGFRNSYGSTGLWLDESGGVPVIVNKVNAVDVLKVFSDKTTILGGTVWHSLNDGHFASGIGPDADLLDGIHRLPLAECLRANSMLTGGGIISLSVSYEVGWTARMLIVSNGRGSHFSTTGYFELLQPTAGTIITGAGGTPNVTVTAAGIALASFTALYYILPIGQGPTSLPANFRVVSINADVEIPETWLFVACRNNDSASVRWGQGLILRPNQSLNYNSYSSVHAGVYLPLTGGNSSANFMTGFLWNKYATPRIVIDDTDPANAADAHRLDIVHQTVSGTTYFDFRFYNDAGSASSNWLRVTRSGYTAATINFTSTNLQHNGINLVNTNDSRLSPLCAASKLLGRWTGAGTGAYQEITIGSNLELTAGGILNATVSGGGGGTVTSVSGATTTTCGLTLTGTVTASGSLTLGGSLNVSATGIDSIEGGGVLSVNRSFRLVGDTSSPAANKYYGTDGTANNRGWHNLPTGGGVATSTRVEGQHSITGGGALTANVLLNLVGDEATPAGGKYYGTDPITPFARKWLTFAHASKHQHGGTDEIAVATRAINSIPKTDSTGYLDSWITPASLVPTGGLNTEVLTWTASGPRWQAAPTGGGVTAHGSLTGLSNDDHSQYHTDGRGDARYLQLTGGVVSGTLGFGIVTRQMINLYGTGQVGFGIHNGGETYLRTSAFFRIRLGGTHDAETTSIILESTNEHLKTNGNTVWHAGMASNTGTTGQVLAKETDAANDFVWKDGTGGGIAEPTSAELNDVFVRVCIGTAPLSFAWYKLVGDGIVIG